MTEEEKKDELMPMAIGKAWFGKCMGAKCKGGHIIVKRIIIFGECDKKCGTKAKADLK